MQARARSAQARAGPRVQGHDRPLRRQDGHAARAPGHDHARQPAVHRRRPQAVQGRPPVPPAGQGARRDRARAAGRHLRRSPRSTRMHFDAVLHDAAEDEPHPPEAARLPGAGARPGDRARSATATSSGCGSSCQARSTRTRACASSSDAATHETVVYGLGELHLRMLLERLREVHSFEVETRPPRIAYRETITAKAEGHHRHKKQTGGAGQFGEVFLRVEPLAARRGFEFVDERQGRRDPGPVHAGGREGRARGAGQRRGRRLPGGGHARDGATTASTTASTARTSPSPPPAARPSWMAIMEARPIVLEPIVRRRDPGARAGHGRHHRRPRVAPRRRSTAPSRSRAAR